MKERILSVDVFRGITIMLMTLVNNPGDWGHVVAPFLHADWHGSTPTDLVFPFFLYIVGVSVVLASPEPHFDKGQMQKIIVRSLRIFTLGLYLNFFSRINLFGFEGYILLFERLIITGVVFYLLLTKYDLKRQLIAVCSVLFILLALAYSNFGVFADVRIPGVLQRIAIVYFVVALLYHKTSFKTMAIVAACCLLGYWAAMALIPVDGIKGNFEAGKNVAAFLDHFILEGHMWASSKTWDPEGLFSTIPAIATGIIGVFTGKFLIGEKSTNTKFNYLIYAGLLLLAVGFFWNKVFPINKALWTSSYVLYTAGLATLLLALLYFVIEQMKVKFWVKPFVIFGVNPMIVFFLSGIFPRVFSMIKIQGQGLQTFIYKNGLVPLFSDPKLASLSWAILYLTFWFAIVYALYRKRMFIKV